MIYIDTSSKTALEDFPGPRQPPAVAEVGKEQTSPAPRAGDVKTIVRVAFAQNAILTMKDARAGNPHLQRNLCRAFDLILPQEQFT
jgi:hypothetical protein